MIQQAPRTPIDRFNAYIEGVTTGDIDVCRFVRLAVARHMRDLKRKDLRFDEASATEAIEFLECLKHSKGKWAGTYLHLEGWQCFIIGSLFGWKFRKTRKRRFRIAFVEVARKNGKSTLAAGIGLKLFAADGEPGAEVYSTATTRAQAKIVHEEAKRMTRKCPGLARHVHITRDNMALSDCKYEPLGAAEDNLDGLNPHGAIVDELHAHKTRGMFDVLDTGTMAREQPLLAMITTAGEGGATESICWEQHDYTDKVLSGIVKDDTWFGIIFGLDEGEDWTDETKWHKPNPNLDVSVRIDDLRAKVRKAKETPAAALSVRQKNFNEWVGSFSAWLAPEVWPRNRGPGEWYAAGGLTPEALEHFRGRPCWVAGDLSSVDDLTGIVAAFPNDAGFVELLAWGFCPRGHALGRTRDKRVPYLTFAEEGFLTLTETQSVDYDRVIGQFIEMRDALGFEIQEIALDPANANYVFTRLADEFEEEQILKHRQSFLAMNDPIKTTQRLLLEGRLQHGGNRALAWCVSNVVTRSDANGNLKLDKERSREKIDLAVALVMAVGRAVAGDAVEEGSVYDNEGVFFI